MTSTFYVFLVALDGSKMDTVLLDFVAERARRHASKVIVAHAVDHAAANRAYGAEVPINVGLLLQELDDECGALLARAAQQLDDMGVDSVETVRLDGSPAESLTRYIATHPVDAIIMGTQGRTGLEKFMLGSVAESVLRLGHVPVFTINATAGVDSCGMPLRRILVGVDDTNVSQRALDTAILLAKEDHAQVRVCHVREAGHNQSLLETAECRALAQHYPLTQSVRFGKPAEQILAEALQWNADVIVVGTHARRGLHHALFGSVAEDIIRQAKAPVLALPPLSMK
jgi:nucleotide-binding universal stress UspA family protein